VGLIGARSGSERIPGKNIRQIAGHPLLAYSIAAALKSDIFDDVVVSTDSSLYAEIAIHYGASVLSLRPKRFSGSTSPDIEWVRYTLLELKKEGREYEFFWIIRPTNPFRTADTITRAWSEFREYRDIDSMRALEVCRQHPGKMWKIENATGLARPYVENCAINGVPFHSNQYKVLPRVYVQNASLEIGRTPLPIHSDSISGTRIAPFLTTDYEGFDLNSDEDWILFEALLASGHARLPEIDCLPYKL